ncbi:MAG: hypothetical protein HYX69_00415 [Planctomycetia bacterium]|nr:hypothetical protein [Planctomycetia bacterium]
MPPTKIPIKTLTLLAVILASGCSSDERLVHHVETASERQAEQNRQIAHQNHELAEATNNLIEADAIARKETLSLQRGLQVEQFRIGQQRDELEAERRQVSEQRHRESILAAVLSDLGLTLACLLPLVLCAYLLHGLRHEPSDRELSDLLVAELASDTPMLLPPYSPPNSPTLALTADEHNAAPDQGGQEP